MERGLSVLHTQVEKQSESINSVTLHTQAVMQLVPDITSLQNEVSNLISHLPQGTCYCHRQWLISGLLRVPEWL